MESDTSVVQIARQADDSTFLGLVEQELIRARHKFGDIRNTHEGYAVTLEELDEFWQGVKTKGTTPTDLCSELIQVAAMACRTAVDCGLL